jgi:Zn-dependent protease with chaperone function
MFDQERRGGFGNNPWGYRGGDDNHYRAAGAGRQRQHPRPRRVGWWKEPWWTAAIAAASLGIWYATPVSRWATGLVLRHYVPIEEDVLLGQQALREGLFSRRYPTVYHARYTPLLEAIGADLVRTYRNQQRRQRKEKDRDDDPYWQDPYRWDFGVARADFVNAFALPGGTIRVTTGLLQLLEPTRGELAALLGHEMGHVLRRHSQAKILQEQLLTNVLQAIIDGYGGGGDDVVGDGGDHLGDPNRRRHHRHGSESFGQSVATIMLKSARFLGDQRFSRQDEYEADAVAWELLMESSRYNPESVIELLRKLERIEKGRVESTADGDSPGGTGGGVASAIEEWTRTHPATSDRLRALERKWNDLPTDERRRLQARHYAS